MPKIKLSHNRFVDVSTEQATKIKDAIMSGSDGNTALQIGDNVMRLREVKEVILTDNEPKIREDKYDEYKDSEFILKWWNEVKLYGGFDEWCLYKQYLIPSQAGYGITAVNADLHQQYTDALEKQKCYRKIADRLMTQEERNEGMRFLK